MPVTRQCPNCGCTVNNRKLVCQCDHIFRRKRPQYNKGRKLHRDSVAKSRALETSELADNRRKVERDRTTRIRALETQEQANRRRKFNRDCATRRRALETQEQADSRRKLNPLTVVAALKRFGGLQIHFAWLSKAKGIIK